MFLRGLWGVSVNGDLIEISQRHLMSAGWLLLVTSRYFTFLLVLHFSNNFFNVLYVHSFFLGAFIFFMCLYFYMCLTSPHLFTCLKCLHFFKEFPIFDGVYVPSPFCKMYSNTWPSTTSWNKQGRGRINQK